MKSINLSPNSKSSRLLNSLAPLFSKEAAAGSLGTLGAGGGLSILVSETLVPYIEEKIVRSEGFATNLSDYFKAHREEKDIWVDVMKALKDGCPGLSDEANVAVLKAKAKEIVNKDKDGKYLKKEAIKNGVENFYKSVNGKREVKLSDAKTVCKEVERVLKNMQTVIRVYGEVESY